MTCSILTPFVFLAILSGATAQASDKKEETIALPPIVVRGINSFNAEAKRIYDRDRKFIESQKEITLATILKLQINNHIQSLREKQKGDTFTAGEKRHLERAREVYERRLKQAEKTGKWSWDDLDVPTKALPKE